MRGTKNEEEDPLGWGNQIMSYLFGFSPRVEFGDEHGEGSTDEAFDTKVLTGPKVNARDAKIHFLMGRYNSRQGLFAHDDLA